MLVETFIDVQSLNDSLVIVLSFGVPQTQQYNEQHVGATQQMSSRCACECIASQHPKSLKVIY